MPHPQDTQTSSLESRNLGVRADSAGLALQAAARAGLSGVARKVHDCLVAIAYGSHKRRVSAGVVDLWYVDVENATGLSRASVWRAMGELRRRGLLVGRPQPADPANNWHRDRARYVLAIPHWCGELLNRARWAARRRLARLNDASPPRPPSVSVTTQPRDMNEKGVWPPPDPVDDGPPGPSTPAAIRLAMRWPPRT